MTVIVGLKHKDRIYIGTDSEVSYGWTKKTLTEESNLKVCRPDKEKPHLLLASCGDVRVENIIRYSVSFIDELTDLKGDFNHKYVVQNVVPNIQNTLYNNNVISKKDNVYQQIGGDFLIAYKDKLFAIWGNGAVIEIGDYITFGSGSEFALGSLNSDNLLDPYKAVENAVRSACKNSQGVGLPIIITDTSRTDYDIIEK